MPGLLLYGALHETHASCLVVYFPPSLQNDIVIVLFEWFAPKCTNLLFADNNYYISLLRQYFDTCNVKYIQINGEAEIILHNFHYVKYYPYRAFHNVLRDYKNLLQENLRTCIYETCTDRRKNSNFFPPQ